jgi:hypothetical protein
MTIDNEPSKENLSGRSTVVLEVLADDTELNINLGPILVQFGYADFLAMDFLYYFLTSFPILLIGLDNFFRALIFWELPFVDFLTEYCLLGGA